MNGVELIPGDTQTPHHLMTRSCYIEKHRCIIFVEYSKLTKTPVWGDSLSFVTIRAKSMNKNKTFALQIYHNTVRNGTRYVTDLSP